MRITGYRQHCRYMNPQSVTQVSIRGYLGLSGVAAARVHELNRFVEFAHVSLVDREVIRVLVKREFFAALE